jgi:hypothetical protein
MIALNYINKSSAAIAAMKDYENMKLIIENTSKEVKDAYDDMFSINSAKLDGLPKAYDPKAGELKIAGCLDRIDLMQERYRQAMEYMAWFEPAWNSLTCEERRILEEFYMQNSQRSCFAIRFILSKKITVCPSGGKS